MKKEDLRIVFMGTPEFAVESLKCLVKGGYNVVAVVTQPDKPVGRKQILTPPPVKQCAAQHNINVSSTVTGTRWIIFLTVSITCLSINTDVNVSSTFLPITASATFFAPGISIPV